MFDKSSRATLVVVAIVQFLVSLDLSVVNVGLPQIALGLGFSTVGLPWVIHAYVLTFGGLLLFGGKAADRYGRKRVLLLGLGLFGLASLAGGFAQEPGHLVAARAAQGVGAAALAPAALLAGFVHRQRVTTREPLVRPGQLANRSVAGANAYNLLVGAAMAAAFYFVSLYLQRVLGVGPARTGVEFLPFALGVVAGSVLAVELGYRLAPRTLLVTGALITAAGFAWFGLISPDGTFVTDVLGPSIVAGVGFGLCLGPVVATATAGVAPQESGTASGLLTSSRQIGASLGLAALGTAAHSRTGEGITPATLNDGYALGLTLCAALLVAAALIALTVLRSGRPTTPLAPLAAPAAAHRAGWAGYRLSRPAAAPFIARPVMRKRSARTARWSGSAASPGRAAGRRTAPGAGPSGTALSAGG